MVKGICLQLFPLKSHMLFQGHILSVATTHVCCPSAKQSQTICKQKSMAVVLGIHYRITNYCTIQCDKLLLYYNKSTRIYYLTVTMGQGAESFLWNLTGPQSCSVATLFSTAGLIGEESTS